MSLVIGIDPDLTSHNGFQWPASGPVEAPDWNPTPYRNTLATQGGEL